MALEDFRINALIRRMLSRCWVNLGSLRFGVVGGAVYFHGRFEKRRTPDPDKSEPWRRRSESQDVAFLEELEREIRKDPAVRDVAFRLDNYRKVRGKWIPSAEGQRS